MLNEFSSFAEIIDHYNTLVEAYGDRLESKPQPVKKFKTKAIGLEEIAKLEKEINSIGKIVQDDLELSPENVFEACVVRNDEGKIRIVDTIQVFYEEVADKISRKEFIHTCIKAGLNHQTVATQYGYHKAKENRIARRKANQLG